MKKLLLALFGLISFAAQAQTDSLPPPVRLNQSATPQLNNKQQLALEQAGLELQRYSRQYYIGSGMMVGGVLVASIAVNSALNNRSGTISPSSLSAILAGYGLVLGGYVVQLASHLHVGRAGRYLREASNGQPRREWKVGFQKERVTLALHF